MNENFDSGIWEKIEQQHAQGGINVRKLPAGTLVIARTKNSVYSIQIMEKNGEVIVLGGEHFPEPRKVYFSGSTFGGSIIKPGWISPNMHMEFRVSRDRRITTGGVRGAKIIGKNWEYDMEWEDDV